MMEYHPISANDQSRLLQFGGKVSPGIFLGYVLIAERIWKGDIVVADIEEVEKVDASEIHARRLNAKEVLTPQRRELFYQSQREKQKCLDEITQGVREPTPRREQRVRSEDLREELQRNSERPNNEN